MKNISFISFSRIGNKYFCTEINRPKSYRADGENDFGRKIGQLNQYNDDITATVSYYERCRQSWSSSCRETRSILNAIGTKNTKNWQDQAMQSRLKFLYFLGKMLFMVLELLFLFR